MSQTYVQRTKENHYILSKDMTAVLSMAHVERATVGMRKGEFNVFLPFLFLSHNMMMG